MANRILIGSHPLYGMGGFVSKPGIDVTTAGKFDFMFSTLFENMQISQSGSLAINGDPVSPGYTGFSWTDLGYFPLILVSCSNLEVQVEYLSTSSGRMRRLNGTSESGSSLSTVPSSTVYYVVLKTQLP